MKTRSLRWKFAIVLLCTTLAYGKDNPAATATYEKALQQLRLGDLKVDFKALRVNCAASKYQCQADPDDIKLLFSLLNDKRFDQALKKVNLILENVFVDAELHYIAFRANSESGNKVKAEFHRRSYAVSWIRSRRINAASQKKMPSWSLMFMRNTPSFGSAICR